MGSDFLVEGGGKRVSLERGYDFKGGLEEIGVRVLFFDWVILGWIFFWEIYGNLLFMQIWGSPGHIEGNCQIPGFGK